MTKPPRGYRREVREVFVKKNSRFSDSQKHHNLKSPLARDANTNDLSHSLIGDRIEPASGASRVVYVTEPSREERRRDAERSTSASASGAAPDIAQLVPLALVAVAGLAAGVVGVKLAQSRRERQSPTSQPAGSIPAGWYEVEAGAGQLRFWDGAQWTDQYAQRASSVAAIAADWYPDPAHAAQLRYWDGRAWTHHVAPRPGATVTPADWYPDPNNAAQLRYWDGRAWTHHVAPRPSAVPHAQPLPLTSTAAETRAARTDPQITMTSAQWRAHVEAWFRAGVIEQEMWRRLTNARLSDADPRTLQAQNEMEQLTATEGAQKIQQLLASRGTAGSDPLADFLGALRTEGRILNQSNSGTVHRGEHRSP
jgi:hypothetical protein